MSPARRYAEWRPVAVRRIPVQWIGIALSLLAALPMCLTSFGGVFLSAPGAFLARWTVHHLAERRLRGLRDDPEDGQFAVTLRLRREVGYGFDEGLLAFVDGWLVYSGRRCSFSVRREDTLGLVVEGERYGFLFQGPAGRHVAIFETARSAHLSGALKAWSEVWDVPGTAVFPPVAPDDQAHRLHRSWPWLGVLFAAYLLIGMKVKFDNVFGWSTILPLVFATPLLAAFYGVQSQRALARIAAGLPYRRNRFARRLGIRPMHAAPATVRSASVKSQSQLRADRLENARWAERSKALGVTHIETLRHEAQAGREQARTMLDDVREGQDAKWAPDADGVLRPKGQTP